MTVQATAPTNAMAPKIILWRVVIGDLSMMATGRKVLIRADIGDVALFALRCGPMMLWWM